MNYRVLIAVMLVMVCCCNGVLAAIPNPYSMISYKAGSSNVQIDNTTPYVGTVVNRNITSNTTVVLGNFTWDTRWFSVSNLRVNTSIAAPSGITLASSSIGNGFANFNVSKPSGMTLSANALLDFDISYVNYTTPGSLGNFSFDTTSKYYDPFNATYWNYITIKGADAIVGEWVIRPDFSANRTLVNTGNSILFTDTGQGEPAGFTNYQWAFGDGGLSTLQNPVYSYAANGNYSVSLTTTLVANSSVHNSTTKTNYITVTSTVLTPPVADFTGTPTVILPGGTVSFTDTSTNVPTSWLWNFGDGSGSSLQNPVHAFNILEGYPLKRNFTVSLTATNAFGSNTTTKVAYISSQTSIAGFNRQDLTMSPEFTLTVNFVDSATNLPIPVVLVMDSLGRNQTTSTGTYTGTYPYSTVVLYLTSSGYDAKSASYIVDEDRVETVQMVKSTTTSQTATTWYVPKTIEFQIIDYAGNQIVGATINAAFNTSSTLAGGNGDLVTWYGMNPTAANNAVNGTLTMTGFSDNHGGVVFTMLSTLSYDVLVTYQSTTNYFNVHPQDGSYQLRFLAAVGPDTSLAHCVYANGNTHTGLSAPGAYNMTLMWSYQDTCGLTSAIDYVVKDPDNNSFIVYNYHLTPVTSGVYVNSLTVSNTRGRSYVWYENATRTV